MTKCQPGCTCKRHAHVISDKARENIARANAARRGESHTCPSGCTCDRHKGYYHGGSKKCPPNCACSKHTATSRLPKERKSGKCQTGCTCGRHSTEIRQRISEARSGTTMSQEQRDKIGEGSRKMWAQKTPEERRQIALNRMERCKPSKVSQHEYALAPYLAALGFAHNVEGKKLWVGRRVPDFYDESTHRVLEYFGTYWHPRPEEEQEVIDHYAEHGWVCRVLWENDLFEWLHKHQHLVGQEEHLRAWKIACRGKRRPVDIPPPV